MTSKARTSKKARVFKCVYCQIGTVKKLPAKCPNCKRSLKMVIAPSTSLRKLVDRAFHNGLRLNICNGGPGAGGIYIYPVQTSQGPRQEEK